MSCWFDKSSHMKAFYLGAELNSIDSVFVKLKPPHDFTRAPQSISKHINTGRHLSFETGYNFTLFYSLITSSTLLSSLCSISICDAFTSSARFK